MLEKVHETFLDWWVDHSGEARNWQQDRRKYLKALENEVRAHAQRMVSNEHIDYAIAHFVDLEKVVSEQLVALKAARRLQGKGKS